MNNDTDDLFDSNKKYMRPVLPDYQTAINMWNQFAKKNNMPLVRSFHKTRKHQIANLLLKHGGLSSWQAILEQIKESPTLLQKVRDSATQKKKMCLDFVLQEKVFLDILYGKYKENKHKMRISNDCADFIFFESGKPILVIYPDGQFVDVLHRTMRLKRIDLIMNEKEKDGELSFFSDIASHLHLMTLWKEAQR